MSQTTPAGNPAPAGGFQTGGWYDGFQYWEGSFAPRAGMIHPSSNQQGAGQAVSQEVNRQTSIAAGLAPTANQEFVDAQNARLDAGQFLDNTQQAISNFFGDGSGIPTRGPSGGGGLINFESIKSQLAPSAAPEPFSRVDTFNQLREQYGVADLEQQLTDLKAQQREAEAQLRINVSAEEAKPVATNVIAGRVSQHTKTARENLDFIQRQQAYVVDQLNSANNVINTYVNFMGMDYQDAVTRYNTEFSQNLQVMDLMRGMRKDAISEEQRRIDNARANLQIYANAVTSGNINPGSLTMDQKLQINMLESQSGLPTGFISRLQMAPDDNIVFTTSNQGVTQVGIRQADGSIKVQSYGTRIGGEGGSGQGANETDRQYLRRAQGDMATQLQGKANDNGHVDPVYWNTGKQAWLSAGLDPEEYDRVFSGYIDTNRTDDAYNISGF